MSQEKTIVIIEDEFIIAKRLRRLATEMLGADTYAIEWFDTVEEAFHFIQSHPVALLLLDLNLHGEDGFQVLERAVAGRFSTIIVSAYDEQAIRAFEYGVLDFVAKPFTTERFRQALERWLQQQRPQEAQPARFLACQKKGKIRLVRVEEITHIEGAGNYSALVLENGARELHAKTLGQLTQMLPPHFERIHRSYIADMQRARQLIVHSGGHYELELVGGIRLPVSRGRYAKIKDKWLLES